MYRFLREVEKAHEQERLIMKDVCPHTLLICCCATLHPSICVCEGCRAVTLHVTVTACACCGHLQLTGSEHSDGATEC